MISTLFMTIIKQIVAGSMALTMALSSAVTGPIGGYLQTSMKTLDMTIMKTEVTLNIRMDLEAISVLAGEDAELPDIPGYMQDGKVNMTVPLYIFTDNENCRIAISLSEHLSEGYAVYIDAEGIAVAPYLTSIIFTVLPVTGLDPAISQVYAKYFADNGMYFSWESLLALDESDAESSAEVINFIEVLVSDAVSVLTSEENLATYVELEKPMFEILNKYYEETTVNGNKAYGANLTLEEIIKASYEVAQYECSEEYLNGYVSFILGLTDDIDYLKYIDMFNSMLPEEERLVIPEEFNNNAAIGAFVKAYVETEILPYVLAAFSEGEFDMITDVFDVILTGKDESGAYPEFVTVHDVLAPFMKNSYVSEIIYEENGNVVENTEIAVCDDKTEYLYLGIECEYSEYDGVVHAAKDVVPFDKLVEPVEIDNKLGYEDAVEKGVTSIDIQWFADMYPEENELEITYPCFYVNYGTLMKDAIINDPTISEEDKSWMIEIYDDDDYEFKTVDCSAELIDNSVYLPLRQLMENAGYEVSWDGEARKAYVTVDGAKIEMTGVIVNNRTYVKVRDFEKLGATVEYEEEFYYEIVYNDFSKICYATITFAK